MKNNLKSDKKMCSWEMKFVSTQKEKKRIPISVLTEGKNKPTNHELSEGNLHVHPNCVVMKLLKPVMLNAWLVMKDIAMET